jgi:hypothetical protein
MTIREVLTSNLGQDTDNPKVCLFVSFLNGSQKIMVYYLKLGHNLFLWHPFRLISHYDATSIIRRYVVLVADSVIKQIIN